MLFGQSISPAVPLGDVSWASYWIGPAWEGLRERLPPVVATYA